MRLRLYIDLSLRASVNAAVYEKPRQREPRLVRSSVNPDDPDDLSLLDGQALF